MFSFGHQTAKVLCLFDLSIQPNLLATGTSIDLDYIFYVKTKVIKEKINVPL